MRRSHFSVAIAALFLLSVLVVPGVVDPPAVAGVSPTPAAPMAMRLEAGRHTGHVMNPSTGAISSSRTVIVSSATTMQSTQRAWVGSRAGFFLRMSGGPLNGLWIRESIVAYVIGAVGQQTFSPSRAITLPVGKVLGYTFDAGWNLLTAPVLTVTSPTTAPASMAAAINGTMHYRITGGPLANSWVPSGGTSRARTLACQTGPRATGGPAVWSRLTSAGPEVALTFDLGGRTDPATAIAKRLLLNGVCVTVFPTGDAAETPAGNAVLEFMDSFPAVFEFGNHTQDHCDLVNGGGGSASCPPARPSAAFVAQQLASAEATVVAITGMPTKPYWRPPYGSNDQGVRLAAWQAGYPKTVMWDIDTIDWRPPPPTDTGPSAVQITDKVVGRAANGSIVLMHLGGYNTYAALPSMILGLRNRGFVPTTVSDLADGR
jgi:peptidoglycan/xylan/chitin deacetylase (PgdA/CDA1 family)